MGEKLIYIQHKQDGNWYVWQDLTRRSPEQWQYYLDAYARACELSDGREPVELRAEPQDEDIGV